MRNVKVSALFKVGMFLVLFFIAGCNNANTRGGVQQDNVKDAMGQDDIKGEEQANEKLKGTIWQTKPDANKLVEAKLNFSKDSNTCTIELPLAETSYVAEYEVKDNKVNLKLDKNIEFFKNYSLYNFLKDEYNEMIEFMEEMKTNSNKAELPQEQKDALKKQLEIFKNAVNDGAFTSQEKFKAFSLDLMIPYILQMIEAQVKDPKVTEAEKEKLKGYAKYMQSMKENPALFDTYIEGTLKEKNQVATYLSEVNPIVLTIPSDKTIETTTTMTAGKIYSGKDSKGAAQYKENVEFSK